MIKIKDIILDSNIILAPMAGITNLAYRKFLKDFGCGLVVSEMISDYALFYNNQETFNMIKTTGEKRPVAIQLFGGSKESILKGAEVLFKHGDFDILDVNLGCPVPKVVKENAGSAWLKKERSEELLDMMTSLVKLSPKPVTAKIRIGWDESSINVIETAKILEKSGVSLISVHGRTRSLFYSGNVDYDVIKKVKESVSIPVIANGDINSLDKAIEVMSYTGCDGIMIGRAALGNPNLIRQIDTYFKTGVRIPDSTLNEQLDYLCTHFNELLKLKDEYHACSEIRGLGTHYFRNIPSSRKYRTMLTQIKSKEEFDNLIKLIKHEVNI